MSATTMVKALCTARPPKALASVTEFWSLQREATLGLSTFDRAVVGATLADRAAYAFAAGYQAALHRLVPDADADALLSLCATEAQGAHPRNIATTITEVGEELEISGEKRFATLSLVADVIFVVGTRGTVDGKAMLSVVAVPRGTAGLRIVPMEELPFVPEIPHATAFFERVRVPRARLLPGDGWQDLVKPFRTIEDIHVIAAIVAYAFATGTTRGFSAAALELLLGALAALRTVSEMPPGDPETHLLLAGALAVANQALDATAAEWEAVDDVTRDRWLRDRPLLAVASRARAARTEAAWKKLR